MDILFVILVLVGISCSCAELETHGTNDGPDDTTEKLEHPAMCEENGHRVIRNSERGVRAPLSFSGDLIDDNSLSPGWYRFASPAGEEITHYCQEVGSCGTKFPIWLQDVPTVNLGQTKNGTLCINTDESGCCNVKLQILVHSCGGFYIYRLASLQTDQPAAYCTGFNEWDLILKGVSLPDHNPGDLIKLWGSDYSQNADVREALLLDTSFPEHYKSSLVSDWNRMYVQKVRLSLYRGGTEVRRFIFNGWGSDRYSWFSQERLLETPYTDMKAQSNFTKFSFGREFCILNVEGGLKRLCNGSRGWFAVVPVSDHCLSLHNGGPSFVYSGTDTVVNWAQGPVGIADVLAIFVSSPLLSIPCSDESHVTINDIRRSADIRHYNWLTVNDKTLRPGWYRFTDPKGEPLNIPTHCVEMHHCSTHYPIWINDELPKRPGERKPLIACINTDEPGCCNQRIYIGALNCGDYIVYGLDRVPSMDRTDGPYRSAGYCTESDRWHLVFKLMDGPLAGNQMDQLWLQDSSINTDIPHARQLDNAFPGNYKTYHVRQWSSQVNKVKVVLYKNGTERVILIFDGEGSNKINWFSRSRLLFSPWIDLKTDNESSVFSIDGKTHIPNVHHIRHLFGTWQWLIAKQPNPCTTNSQGWIMTVNRYGWLCPLRRGTPIKIMYSNTNSAENWNLGSVEEADFMAVFLSFKTTGESCEQPSCTCQ